nr:HAD family hydrolase [uncultured Rhodopila sp.]
MKLSDFRVLSFDCYGTLIDWESGIWSALAPLRSRVGAAAGMGLARAGVELTREDALAAFARLESRQQDRTPGMAYPEVLASVHGQLAAEWDVAGDAAEDAAFGASIGHWPAFPDTAEALAYLKQHFRLVVLSNVDRAGFAATQPWLGVAFDAVYTAQDIGSYKPDVRNFHYLLERLRELGLAQEQVLHVAQSLFHDHVPANALGLASAWIDRRGVAGGATAPVAGDVRWDFRFGSLGELVKAHRGGSSGS